MGVLVLPTAVLDGRTRSQYSTILRTLEGLTAAVGSAVPPRADDEQLDLIHQLTHLIPAAAIPPAAATLYACTAIVSLPVPPDGPAAAKVSRTAAMVLNPRFSHHTRSLVTPVRPFP